MKSDARASRRLIVSGTVQGVGFRPFVFRLAQAHGLAGDVKNVSEGVAITIEGTTEAVDAFLRELSPAAPTIAAIDAITVEAVPPTGRTGFSIQASTHTTEPLTQLPADLPVCDECLRELFDPADRRHGYPYITCVNCGPRYSLSLGCPYDRVRTTMAEWEMCRDCSREFHSPADRRFHAQPIACPACGPQYHLVVNDRRVASGDEAVAECARLLRSGHILALKSLGGYHLACDATNPTVVTLLRHRKRRDTKPFALMVRDLVKAREIVHLTPIHEALLTSIRRPIVLARARVELAGVAPGQARLGVMLPYTPVHHMMFEAAASSVLVMTSGNVSGEPMVFDDDQACSRLTTIADAVLVGERRIARRVDDSVVSATAAGPIVLRRARGYAPAVVARFPDVEDPILAVGADLKNALTIAIGGKAVLSQHFGDLDQYAALTAFQQGIHDLLSMYEIDRSRLVVVHDQHPEYATTQYAVRVPARRCIAVQHHRAHIASVLAERQALDLPVVGIAFDGSGFGDDGTTWGGEFFIGSVAEGFTHVAHLRRARLPGGDASARFPTQAAAGFLWGIDGVAALNDQPFSFPPRYAQARQLVAGAIRTFETTSVGRLFDVVAALLGFNREITFEGEAAMWLEALGASTNREREISLPFDGRQLDFEPALRTIIDLRSEGVDEAIIARSFHVALAHGTAQAVKRLIAAHRVEAIVASGGVFQNVLLLERLREALESCGLPFWLNHDVPAGDGGISLGQAAIAAAMLRNERRCQ